MPQGDILALATRVSNWGRWGASDELGTLNHITPESRVAALSSVRSGEVLSLSLPLEERGPQPPTVRRRNPQLTMLDTGSDVAAGVQSAAASGIGWADDMVTMALQAATHWDSLAHCFHNRQMYNNRDCALVSAEGAANNSIQPAADRVIGRGVLLDVASVKHAEVLPPGYPITASDISEALERQRVAVRPGDILLVRTGHLEVFRDHWSGYTHAPAPGIDVEALPLLHELKIAALATDTWALEVIPSGIDRSAISLRVHAVAIVYMGLLLGENFVLEELARKCRHRNDWTFYLSAAPLPFARAVSGLTNPIALL